MESSSSSMLDRSALKFNQISIIIGSLTGFILDEPVVPLIVAFVLILGSIIPEAALFKAIYRYLIRPLGIMKPEPAHESQTPHLFAQLIGGIVLAAGSLLLYRGDAAPGWILVWIVILLAAVNLAFGFCTGCFMYFQLGKLGLPGFHDEGTLTPGGKHG